MEAILRVLFPKKKFTPKQLRKIILEVDADGSGEIEFDEVRAGRVRPLTLACMHAAAPLHAEGMETDFGRHASPTLGTLPARPRSLSK